MNVAEKEINLNIAADFSKTPGPRFRSEGKYSGEEFRDTILKQRFEQAIEQGAKLQVDLDGGYGYAPSFLEEAFGGLSRKYGYDSEQILETIMFKSEEEPYLADDIRGYVRKARG